MFKKMKQERKVFEKKNSRTERANDAIEREKVSWEWSWMCVMEETCA